MISFLPEARRNMVKGIEAADRPAPSMTDKGMFLNSMVNSREISSKTSPAAVSMMTLFQPRPPKLLMSEVAKAPKKLNISMAPGLLMSKAMNAMNAIVSAKDNMKVNVVSDRLMK